MLVVIQLDELKTVISKTVTDAIQTVIPPQEKDPFADYPENLTRSQTKEILGVKSLATVDNYANQGILNKRKIGSTVRYKKTEVLDALKSMDKKKGGEV